MFEATVNGTRCLFALTALLTSITSRGALAAADQDTPALEAVLSVQGYGYAVKILVNGADVGVTGGKSEGTRLFSPNHEMAAQAAPELRQQMFVLKEGINDISIDYKRLADADPLDKLEVSFEATGYPAPMLFLVGRSAASRTVRKKIDLAAKAPESFRPITVADGEEGRLVLLTIRTDGVTASPVLNGTPGMTLVNRPGTVALDAVKSGQNRLQIELKGKAGQALTFSVATPEAFRSFTRQIGSHGEHAESVTFAAP